MAGGRRTGSEDGIDCYTSVTDDLCEAKPVGTGHAEMCTAYAFLEAFYLYFCLDSLPESQKVNVLNLSLSN